MHFFYIDEAGSDSHDLGEGEQPIFVSGGIILKDESWDKTHLIYQSIIAGYFNGKLPDNFVLHIEDLFAEDGKGDFKGHTEEKRMQLVTDLTNLVAIRRHNFYYLAIDKNKLNSYDTTKLQQHFYFNLKKGYLIAYDHLITAYEQYTKVKIGKTAKAMVIIEEKHSLQQQVEDVINYRRFTAPVGRRLKNITEFSYPVSPERNMMIQLSDLLLYITRKYLEIDNGYCNEYTTEKKTMFRNLYKMVYDRLIFKKPPKETGYHAEKYNSFIDTISSTPDVFWKEKVY